MGNFKEIICNNDIINDVNARQKYIENKCFNYDYIKEKYNNNNYHILQNSNINTTSKEFLQKMLYDVFLEPLKNCQFWDIQYNFNYLENDFTTILQVIVFYNEKVNIHQIDLEGDLQTLSEIEMDKIQHNFVTFQNQCIFCLHSDFLDTFVNKEEIHKISDFRKEIENYIDTKYPNEKENLLKRHLFFDHYGQNYYNVEGDDFNLVQTFGGDNFDGFLITCTEQ